MYQNIFKLSLLFLLLLPLGFYNTFSQNQDNNTSQTVYKEVNENVKINDEGKKNLDRVQNVLLRFCNDGFKENKLTKDLSIIARPGEKKEICIIILNKNLEKVTINLGLSSAKKDVTIVCNLDGEGYNWLGKNLLTNYNESDFSFSLMPNEQILKNFIIQIPKTQTGDIFGCASIKIDKDIQKADTGQMFSLEIAKNSYMEITITGSVYNYGRLDDIKYSIKNNQESILKGFIIIIGLRLVISIVQQISKKQKEHHKK